ncbi:MAG: hypothetical protein WBA76_01025 [Phormidesmis sp.]
MAHCVAVDYWIKASLALYRFLVDAIKGLRLLSVAVAKKDLQSLSQ